jgi:MHS family proline/betaine transporter-like MFS transporter
MSIAEQRADAGERRWSLKRVVTAGVIGNVLEWYDFAIYGFFAPILAAQFFPTGNRMTSLLAAFGTFAVGFLMRPVGAALFGHIGDRYGRARALLLSIAMMAIPTALMGLLPTYASIGIAAAIAMVVLRMCQGLAVGGEFTSSIVFLAEHAPPRRRGFVASWAVFGATSGTMLGAAVGGALSRVLSPEALASWGWRVAFISGIAVGVVGLMIRRNMFDTPTEKPEQSPLKAAFRNHGKAVLRVVGLNMAPAATYYVLFVYAATWLAETGGVVRAVALDITTATILTFLVVVPIAAKASDRFGRKRVLVTGLTACLVLGYPLVNLMASGETLAIALGQMGFAALLGIYMSALPAAMCEMFPRSVRVSAVSVGYSLAYAIFGGTAPMVAVWLIGTTGTDIAFVWYLIGITAVSLSVALTMPEPSPDLANVPTAGREETARAARASP